MRFIHSLPLSRLFLHIKGKGYQVYIARNLPCKRRRVCREVRDKKGIMARTKQGIKAKHWVTFKDDLRQDLLLLTTLIDCSTTHFIRSCVEAGVNVLKDEMFDTDQMMNEFIRWKDSIYKPETPEDFEKILQQKLIDQGRGQFKESILASKSRGKYNKGRPRKDNYEPQRRTKK